MPAESQEFFERILGGAETAGTTTEK